MRLVLQVNSGRGWRDLQPFAYDEADKFNTRKSVFKRAKLAWMRWADNYAQYRDASFRIVERNGLELLVLK